MALDERDLEILDILREHGRITNRAIAEITGIPITTILHRIKSLEDEKYIYHYSARVNYHKAGWNTVAWLLVYLDAEKCRTMKLKGPEAAKIIRNVSKYISHISAVAGSADIALRIHVRDPDHLNEEVGKIRDITFIERTETMVGLYSDDLEQLESGLSSGSFRKKSKGFEKIKKG